MPADIGTSYGGFTPTAAPSCQPWKWPANFKIRERPQAIHQLGPPHLQLVTGAEVRAARDLLLDRAHHRGVAVAEEQRAVSHPVVDVLVTVDVPLPGAARALDVDRERQEVANIVGDSAGNRRSRALGEGGRARMPRAELLLDRHGPHDTPSSATTDACTSRGSASTVGSRRRVTPSCAPASTHA